MSDGAEAGQQVKLYVYDLSQGMARAMSSMLLGTQLDGIWHTGVVVGDTEYFYGGGIQKCRAGTTPFGQPTQKLDMGTTQLPDDVIQDFLSDIAPRFTAATYSLFRHNCNHFSDELCTFLLGSGIPDDIVSLPETVLSTPMGMMIAPFMQQMESQLSHVQAGSAALPPLFPAAAPVGPPVTASTREPAPSAAAAAAAAASDRQAAAAAQKLRALAGRDAASWSGELAAAATNTGQPVQDTACQQAEVRDRQKRALAAEFQRLVASGTPPNEAAAAALKKVVGKPPS